MSRPLALTLPPGARTHRLETTRGSFAALECTPPDDVPLTGTVLMVPGFLGSKEDFLPLLAPLSAAGIRAVAVDGRGQHETPGPEDETAYEQNELAADVWALSATLVGNTPSSPPLHLLGHSLGGLIARAAVLSASPAAPHPWSSLTLMSSGPAAIQPDQQKRVQLLVEWLPLLGKEQLWHEMQKLEEREAPGPDLAKFLYRRWLNTVPQQLTATGRQLTQEPDRVDELATASLPTLIVCGQEDYAWPVPWQLTMAARLGAPSAVIPNSAHSPNAENPEGTARALISFWGAVTNSHRPSSVLGSADPSHHSR